MKDELFQELTQSIREAKAIRRGSIAPGRVFEMSFGDIPNVAALRQRYQLSQEKFASLLGISVHTFRNWEQGKRVPEGPARVLLKIAAKHPEAILDTVRAA